MAAMLIWFEIFGLYFLLRVLRFSLEALVGIFPVHFSEKAPKKKKKAPTAPCSHAAKADVGTGGAVPAGADRSNRSPQLSLHVCLVSGRSLDLRLPANAGLAELRWRVEKELSAGSVELIKSSGDVLQGNGPLKGFGLQDGDLLYATVRNRPILATSSHCNALILIDQEGSVKALERSRQAWGENVPPSKMLLKDIRRLQISAGAAAAILPDGSVAAWGAPEYGGDVGTQLPKVLDLESTQRAFAALCEDRTVVTWGAVDFGGDCSSVQEQLRGVRRLQSTQRAFAALCADGRVVAWGNEAYGGDARAVQDELVKVKRVEANAGAFAALRTNGTVVTWGRRSYGGDSGDIRQLYDIVEICAADTAFAALCADGRVVAWGESAEGGNCRAVKHELRQVWHLAATGSAFAALRADGHVVTWGHKQFGGDSTHVQEQLRDVKRITASKGAFAALCAGGRVVTWGDEGYGGQSDEVQRELRDVQKIYATTASFGAMCEGGRVVTWPRAQDPAAARIRV